MRTICSHKIWRGADRGFTFELTAHLILVECNKERPFAKCFSDNLSKLHYYISFIEAREDYMKMLNNSDKWGYKVERVDVGEEVRI